MATRKKMAGGAVVLLAVFGFALAGGSPDPFIPACSDGLDNDGDGFVDNNDDGCRLVTGVSADPGDPPPSVYCPSWDDETTPPQDAQQCGI